MSEKLKIMQIQISDEGFENVDLYCASIGYPDLKTLPTIAAFRHQCDNEQPRLDGSAFRDYVSKAEYVALTSSQTA